jgi:hypothetical protein
MFDFQKFYNGLLHRTNFFDNYLDQFPEGRLKRYKTETLTLLKENIKNKDEKGLATTLGVIFLDGADEDYTDLLLSTLDEDWHKLKEDIISVLELTKDPKSIQRIYEAAINIPDYDDGRSVAKKCIWALGAINTASSKEKLKLLQMSDDPIIRKAATMELEHTTK